MGGPDIYYNTGMVGIGTTTPTANLEVAGTLKIIDGNQGANKVLTSDADGLASWQDASAVGETDPVFIASDAYGVTSILMGQWSQAYGWGNHSTVGYLTTETDPVFGASVAAGIGAGNITNWNTAYGWGDHASAGYLITETDP